MISSKFFHKISASPRFGVEVLFSFMAAAALMSCENDIVSEISADPNADGEVALVKINGAVSADYQAETSSSETTTVEVSGDICTRFDIAIYNNEERIIRKAQQVGEADFGTLTAELEIGTTYQIVAIAHSCEKAMTTTDIHNITANREVTDMFWAYAEVTPTEGMNLTLTLQRIVAKVRFGVGETTPAKVKSMYFYYTGGSSTFDGTTGEGSVQSKQSVQITTPDSAYTNESWYEFFTVPRPSSESLDLTVKAFDADESIVKQAEYTSVRIERNHITELSGKFFSEEINTDPDPDVSDSKADIQFNVNTEWDGTIRYSY